MRSVIALVLSLSLSGPLAAQAIGSPAAAPPAGPAQTEAPIRDLAPMVVSGVQPGPGLWQVVNDDGHVLWVLGVVQPLPAGLQWRSTEVEAVIAHADGVLHEPGLAVHWDLGFFSGLALLPSALRVRRNPDGGRLEDVLAPDLYARWLVQKEKYLGWEWATEKWRPVFAADKLHEAALEQHGLDGVVIDPVIAAATRAAGLEPTPVVLRTSVEEPRALVKEFNRTALDDVACMERTLTRLEHELPVLVERANAWATGDIETLRRLPTRSVEGSCLASILESDLARRHGYRDLERQVRELWLETAEQALADNAVTFALLPMGQVLAEDGYLAELAARGHRVIAPDAGDEPITPAKAEATTAGHEAGPIDTPIDTDKSGIDTDKSG